MLLRLKQDLNYQRFSCKYTFFLTFTIKIAKDESLQTLFTFITMFVYLLANVYDGHTIRSYT